MNACTNNLVGAQLAGFLADDGGLRVRWRMRQAMQCTGNESSSSRAAAYSVAGQA